MPRNGRPKAVPAATDESRRKIVAKEIIMPKAGMDMKEGVIVRWLVEVGGKVKEGDAVLEIETDKVTMEVESPADGVLLRRFFEDGATVPVVTVIGYVGTPGEKVPDAPSEAGLDAAESAPAKGESGTNPSGFDFDVAIVGGGPAGYVAAIRVSQLGGKAILFERDTVGGTCLNRGCIPTKTYLKTAEYIHSIERAAERGITLASTEVSVDMLKIRSYKDGVVKKLTSGVAALLKSRNVTVVNGEAKLSDKNTVECSGKRYSAGSIIICGGSVTGTIPLQGVDGPKVSTSDEMLQLEKVPSSLAVIGGGVIGCELATAFAAFGSKVTIIEALDRLVPMFDAEISFGIQAELEKKGITVLTARKVERIEDNTDTAAIIMAGGQTVKAERILLSVGRSADLSCLSRLAGSIRTERGKVVVDSHCRTSISNIYAAGDITTAATLAHAAFKMGETAAANAMGGEEEVNLKQVPSCLYTMPEAAAIGMSEEEAAKRGEIRVGRFPFSANGRALASGEPEGMVKVIIDAKFGEILGVHIIGANATEMIAEAKALIDSEVTAHEAAEIMHAHPTFGEVFMEAMADALGNCIHLPPKK